MRKNCQIYSNDIFLFSSISVLLEEIFTIHAELREQRCHILIINKSSLLDLPKIYGLLDKSKSYIVISSPIILNILCVGELLKLNKFINITAPLLNIKQTLIQSLQENHQRHSFLEQTKEICLSRRERVVFAYLSKGKSPTLIAKITGLSVKTISAQKRSIMKKLSVTTDQQFLIKSQMMNLMAR